MVLHQLHEGIKKKARFVADLISTYGVDIAAIELQDYGTYVGVVLNQSRVDKQRAVIFLEAITAALGPSLDKSLFDAKAPTEEIAEVEFNRYRARQAVEQALRSGSNDSGGSL